MKKIIALALGTLGSIGIGNTSENHDVDQMVQICQNEDVHLASYHINSDALQKFEQRQNIDWMKNLTRLGGSWKVSDLFPMTVIQKHVRNRGQRNDGCWQFDTDYLIPAIIVTTQVDDEEAAIRCYNDETSQKSVHFLIRPNGEIIECVPLSKRAWGDFDISRETNRDFRIMMDVYHTWYGSPADVCGIYIGLIKGENVTKQAQISRQLIKILMHTYEIPGENVFKMQSLNNRADRQPVLKSASTFTPKLMKPDDSDEESSSSDSEDSPVSMPAKQKVFEQDEESSSSSDSEDSPVFVVAEQETSRQNKNKQNKKAASMPAKQKAFEQDEDSCSSLTSEQRRVIQNKSFLSKFKKQESPKEDAYFFSRSTSETESESSGFGSDLL